MATATAPTNGKVAIRKFQPGFEPETIALAFSMGKPVNSTYDGDQVMFTLIDGRKWFADLIVGQKIDRMRIQPGEPFEVCKTERREGNRRIVEVEITAVVVETPKAEPAGLVAAGHTNNQNYPLPNGTAVAAPAAVPMMNGNGETSAIQLARCYREAVDIAILTVEYAKKVGLSIAPCFEDIRCMAATLCISETGRR